MNMGCFVIMLIQMKQILHLTFLLRFTGSPLQGSQWPIMHTDLNAENPGSHVFGF